MAAMKCTLLMVGFVTVAILETLLFAFLQAGWSSFVYVLIDNGFYSNLCEQTSKYANISQITNVTYVNIRESPFKSKDLYKNLERNYTLTLNSNLSGGLVNGNNQLPTVACLEQQERLHLLYTISTVLIELFTVTWGPLVYRFGAIGPKVFSMILFMSGCLMLGLSSPDIPLLIVPGLTLVSFGGMGVVIINMEVSSILPFGKGLYIAILNGACDSSVITFRIIKSIYEAGIPDLYPFIGLIVLHFIICGSSLILHKTYPKQPLLIKYDSVSTKDCHTEKQTDTELQTRPHNTQAETASITHRQPSLKESLCSVLTISALCWVSILMLNFLMYLGTINARLQEAFPEQVSHFTNVLAYAMIGGIVSFIIPGTVFEWQSKMFEDRQIEEEKRMLPNVLPLAIASMLAIILNILSFFKSAAVFYTEFVVLTVFRSFLYGTFMSFFVSIYPLKHANVLFPLGLTIGGLTSMVQIAIFSWYNQSENSQLQVKMFMTFLVALTLIHPIVTLLKGKRMFSSRLEKQINGTRCDESETPA